MYLTKVLLSPFTSSYINYLVLNGLSIKTKYQIKRRPITISISLLTSGFVFSYLVNTLCNYILSPIGKICFSVMWNVNSAYQIMEYFYKKKLKIE